eukprot:Blabericola_migrator_1__3178@NODE_1930_length_3551_cov_17_920494_g1234_i0_p1_GENE_NODE_1930_length_3551_cov_17_920494_g1234_i0NODE_1930_length_3551_cov_17_920494_g1234_i0_p1_ORF_typecomplete_len1102_score217_19N_BRCA1_IG/PF16158_5/0_38_NODE_1930_length_3551_cov_17_920494_g1234_i01553460
MPSYNLTVAPTSTVGAKTVFVGLLCTLPSQNLSLTANENVATICSRTTPTKKKTMKKPYRITDMTTLNEVLKKEPGTVCVMKPTSKKALSRVRELAIQSDSAIAEGIKLLEAKGVKYHIEIRKKSSSVEGREGGALGLWDVTGIDRKSSLYTQVIKNQANLANIETVNEYQAATIKKLLTIVGHLARIAPDSPNKNQTVQFKYFLEEVSEVVSDLKKTNAPKALLSGVVSAVFAKYKRKYWDGVMKLAGVEAATELQACADVLLDSQHINDYLKLVETAQVAPPGPSSEEFDVAFGLLSEVDTEMTSLFRDIIVYLHDIVKPQVDSLDKIHASKINRGMKDGEIELQVNQLNICIRNYTQCFYNIAQDFAQIKRMSVPNKEARLQASMYTRIAGVSRKFWPALQGCLEKLCDSTVVADIKSKDETLRKQLFGQSLLSGQLASDEQSATVKDSSSETIWNRMVSCITNLLSSGKDGLKERDITAEHDHKTMSPMFSDLLEIVEQLKTYGQIASSSPEESPDVPDTIEPGDRIAICGALGFVSKPKAAALFSYLKQLQKCLEFIDYEAFANEKELASVKKFLHVDYHIMKAIQDEGHSLGVHGNMETAECDQIMTSTFDRYFKECWPHVSAVLEGGDQEESIKVFEGMATDISNWRDSRQELNSKSSQVIQNYKKVANVNAMWYLAGMLTFLQGASSEGWKLQNPTQDIWTDGFCLRLKPGRNRMLGAIVNHRLVLCLPDIPDDVSDTADYREEHLPDIATRQTFGSEYAFEGDQMQCASLWDTFPNEELKMNSEWVYYDEDGNPSQDPNLHQSEIIEYAQKDGIDVTCKKSFKARWYNATDQVIKELCNRVYDKTLRKFHEDEQQRWDQLLLDQYHFALTTHYQGLDFTNSTVNSNYEGFVMCSDADNLTDQEALDKFDHIGSYRADMEAQKLCTKKPWGRWGRPISVFHTALDIDRDGQISIQNDDHNGHIGSCVPILQERVQAAKRREHASNGTQRTKPMSGKEIKKLVDAFAEEKQGPGMNSSFASQWKDAESFSLTQTPLVSGAEVAPHVWSNSILTYLPYVAAFIGGIGSVFAVKRARDCFKKRPGDGYEEAATNTV